MFNPSFSDALEFRVGDAYYFGDSLSLAPGCYRVVYIDPVYSNVHLKRLPEVRPSVCTEATPKKRKEPFIRKLSLESMRTHLKKSLASQISVIDPMPRMVDTQKLSPRRQAIYLQRLPVLQAMLDPDILLDLLHEERAPVFSRLAVAYKLSPQEVRRLFNRLLDLGLDPTRAAVTGHDRCGRQAGRQYIVKQGRPRTTVKNGRAPEWKGINVNKQHLVDIDLFLQSSYRPDLSNEQNFRDFKSIFFVKQIHSMANGSLAREMCPTHQEISSSQFAYHVKKRLLVAQRTLSKERLQELSAGDTKRYLGSARKNVPTPSHSLIIDSTLADVYLVCSWDRSKLIGRPVVYTVIDSLTSCIVGLHITLRPPSAREAKMALYRALTDKKDWLTGFGLQHIADLFPTSPVPFEFVWDRGELHSEEGREVGNSLGINIGIPPPYTPQWKAVVERFFKTLNDYVIHWLPGSTMARMKERGQRDVRFDACLTMNEFTRVILHGIAIHNLRGKSSLPMHTESVVDDQTPSPAGLFEWGLKNLHGSPRYLRADEAVHRLLFGQDCTVGQQGIDLDNLTWASSWMKDPSLGLSGLLQQPGTLYRNPNDPCASFVRMGSEQILRPVRLSPKFKVEPVYSEFDVDDWVQYERDTKAVHSYATEGFETSILHASKTIVNSAQTLTRAAQKQSPQSKAGFLRDTTKNREDEIDEQVAPRRSRQSNSRNQELAPAELNTTQLGAALAIDWAALRKSQNKG